MMSDIFAKMTEWQKCLWTVSAIMVIAIVVDLLLEQAVDWMGVYNTVAGAAIALWVKHDLDNAGK